MKTSSTATLKAQVDILAAVMQEILRALGPTQAQAVTMAVHKKLTTGKQESDAADEAQIEVLVPLLDALACTRNMNSNRLIRT